MPLKRGKNKANCISINYKELKSAGRTHKVAQAGSLNHCSKIWGDAKNELEQYSIDILFEKFRIDAMRFKLAKVLKNIVEGTDS